MLQFIIAVFCIASLFSEEKITSHTIELEGQKIHYTATVSTGDVSYISYCVQSDENRPITFAFNGGPGSSSVWLHIGAFGPRRFVSSEDGGTLTPPYEIVDNLDTILDLTDLVFIDPAGTGFSKEDENCYGVTEDIEAIGKFIRNYLTQNGRWNAKKYIAGESYGAMRAAGVADYLQNEFGIYLNGMALISAAIDFQVFLFEEDNALPYFLYLPSYATTAWYHGKGNSEESVEQIAQKARDFIYETYAPSLICPKCHDTGPIYEKISELTGLSLQFIEQKKGKVSDIEFANEFLHNQNHILGRFDSRMSGRPNCAFGDPSFAKISGPISAIMHDYLHKELEFPDSYTLFSLEANKKWNYHSYNSWGYPSLMNALRSSLASNPAMKVFVGCGYFDLATPFATVEYCIDHLDIPEANVQMEYYEGGHMFYSNPQARGKFKQDLIQFYN